MAAASCRDCARCAAAAVHLVHCAERARRKQALPPVAALREASPPSRPPRLQLALVLWLSAVHRLRQLIALQRKRPCAGSRLDRPKCDKAP